MPPESAPEPWRSLLAEIDDAAEEAIELHCIGALCLRLYGLTRTTVDLDFLFVAPLSSVDFLEHLAGKGSSLHRKYRLYLQYVPILEAYPENYAERIVQLFFR